MEATLELLEKPACIEVLFCIISSKNYAATIVRELKKKQPTVTEQLKELEKVGLIKPLQREKSQKYKVNWDLLLWVFYDVINEAFEDSMVRCLLITKKEMNRIKEIGVERIVPPPLIKTFLQEYFTAFKELGGKRKEFDEIIFSFLAALSNLRKISWRKLVKKFGLDVEILATLANLMEFEIGEIGQVALGTDLDCMSKGGKDGQPV
ncbi:MAG TPA: hypothetical protein VKV31_00295 [bacterium]|nr:hypothetical protein [bacterium]